MSSAQFDIKPNLGRFFISAGKLPKFVQSKRFFAFLSLVICLIGLFSASPTAQASSFSVPPQKMKIQPMTATTPNESVVAVHGLNAGDSSSGQATNGSYIMPGCENYWQDARNVFSSHWGGDFRQISFYNWELKANGSECANNGNDHTYSANLQDSFYSEMCSNVGSGNTNAGSNNESIDHISCLLAWYLYYNFGQHGWSEALVGHSMGGIIIRRTLQLVRDHASDFPTNIGHVTDAIAFNAPNVGKILATWGCFGCYQGYQLTPSSAFMQDMLAHGQAPSVSGTVTDWTVVASTSDILVGDTAIDTAANHKVLYTYPYYDHGGAIHDTSWSSDAHVYYCDTGSPLSNYCEWNTGVGRRGPGFSQTSYAPEGLEELFYSIKYYDW